MFKLFKKRNKKEVVDVDYDKALSLLDFCRALDIDCSYEYNGKRGKGLLEARMSRDEARLFKKLLGKI